MLSDKITVRGQTLLAFSLFILCCLFVCGGAAFADGDQLSGTISKPQPRVPTHLLPASLPMSRPDSVSSQ